MNTTIMTMMGNAAVESTIMIMESIITMTMVENAAVESTIMTMESTTITTMVENAAVDADTIMTIITLMKCLPAGEQSR